MFPSVENKNTHDSGTVVNGDNGGCIFSDDNVKALRYAFEKGHLIGSAYFAARLTARSIKLIISQ